MNPWRRLVDPNSLEYFYANKETGEKFWEETRKLNSLWIRRERPSECRYAFYENKLTAQRCYLDNPRSWKILTSNTYKRPYWSHKSKKYSSWVDPVTWVPKEGKWWNSRLEETRNASPFRALSCKLKRPQKDVATTPESLGGDSNENLNVNNVWNVYVDPKTKHRFFYNSQNGKRQWNVPNAANDWILGETKTGRKYFFNVTTKTSVWNLPSTTPKRRQLPSLDIPVPSGDDAKASTPPRGSFHDENMRIEAKRRWTSAVDKIKSALSARRGLLMSPMDKEGSKHFFKRPSRKAPTIPAPIAPLKVCTYLSMNTHSCIYIHIARVKIMT